MWVRIKVIKENPFWDHPLRLVRKRLSKIIIAPPTRSLYQNAPLLSLLWSIWHTHPNCYKWLATQQSNSVSSLGNQNQLQLSLAPLGELLKEVMLLSNFNRFNFPPYPSEQRFMQKKGSPSRSPIKREQDSKWFILFSDLLHGSCCGLSQSSFDVLFVCFFLLFCFKLFL